MVTRVADMGACARRLVHATAGRLARHGAATAPGLVLALALLLGAGLGGCGGGGSSLEANQMRVRVRANPEIEAVDPGGSIPNLAYVSVGVCDASGRCVKVPDVQLDTGSTGLRLRARSLAGLDLAPLVAANGDRIDTCAAFGSGYLWGSVMAASVQLAGEAPVELPIQVYGAGSPAPAVPAACASTGNDSGTLLALGANGLLGVDAIASDGSAYFACHGSTCTLLGSVAQTEQVGNPVRRLGPHDDNGVILSLPAIPASGAIQVQGTLTFGLDTRVDNRTMGFAAIPTDGYLRLNVAAQGSSHPRSIIDSATNAYYGPLNLPYDGQYLFFTPRGLRILPITLSSEGGTLPDVSVPSSIRIADATSLSLAAYAYDDYGRYQSARNIMVLGLPYFFGRSIAYAMAGTSSGLGTGPIIGVLRP